MDIERPAVPPTEDRRCRACGKALRFVQVPKSGATDQWTTVPLDLAAPTYELLPDGTYRRSVAAFVSHFATCPKASEFSRKQSGAQEMAGGPSGGIVALGPDDAMPFGKHQGTLMRDLPSHYLRWAHGNLTPSTPAMRGVLAYIEEHGCNE